MRSDSVLACFRGSLCFAVGVFTFLHEAHAANPAQWQIVEEIQRADTVKSWNSTTSIDLDKTIWSYHYEITKMTATVIGFVGDVTLDITDSIPNEDRIASGEMSVLPAVLFNDTLVEPESDTSLHIRVDIDSDGLGHAVFSNIMLGSINAGILGRRPIQRINVEALINVTGYDHGDFNRDGHIDAADYVVWRNEAHQGIQGYEVWRQNFGRTGVNLASGSIASSTLNQLSVPECASALLALIGSSVCFAYRCRRKSNKV